MTFDEAFERVIGHEGELVDNPADPGGLTKYGISQRAYPGVDIKALTLDDAKRLYKRDYWDRAMADQYDGAIGFQLFDAAVNSGVSAAIKMLQRAVGVQDDGVVGARTVAAIRATPVARVLLGFNAERLEYMANAGGWPSFGKGWSRRVAGNLRFAAKDL